MAQKQIQTIWGIHAGKTGDAHTLFKENNVMALGWMEMGDLNTANTAPAALSLMPGIG
jgi:hypothetical protein